jgi:hypothetical protein
LHQYYAGRPADDSTQGDEYMVDESLHHEDDEDDNDGDDALPSELEDREPDTDLPPDEIDKPDLTVA